MRSVSLILVLSVLVSSAGGARGTPIVRASTEEIVKPLVVFGSPRYCDCLQCLNAETHFRQKYCRFGELVRSSERVREIHHDVMKLAGVDHLSNFLADDFYRAYCDFGKCPSVPQKCCSNRKDTLRKGANHCPRCLPVDYRYRSTCAVP